MDASQSKWHAQAKITGSTYDRAKHDMVLIFDGSARQRRDFFAEVKMRSGCCTLAVEEIGNQPAAMLDLGFRDSKAQGGAVNLEYDTNARHTSQWTPCGDSSYHPSCVHRARPLASVRTAIKLSGTETLADAEIDLCTGQFKCRLSLLYVGAKLKEIEFEHTRHNAGNAKRNDSIIFVIFQWSAQLASRPRGLRQARRERGIRVHGISGEFRGR